jgi:hypothetical protein
MFIERFVPLFRLKICIAGGGLWLLVSEHRADQVKRSVVPHQPRIDFAPQIMDA